MARALDVARFLIGLAAAEPEPELLTHLRLQKLLYYAQGWHLAEYGLPLFPERIEAWAHGPVVRDLYPHFAGYGYQPIPFENIPQAENLTAQEMEHLQAIWEVYKAYSASKLREMTHAEQPWKDVRKGFEALDPCKEEITTAALEEFFGPLLDRDE